MKITELEGCIKKALEKNPKSEAPATEEASQEGVPEEKVASVSGDKDLFGYPVEDEGFVSKSALHVESDVDEPKEVEIPDSDESFTTSNSNSKGEDADVGDEPADRNETDITGTGEGPEY